MNRRKNIQSGMVTFPLKSKVFRSTKEGGMFVVLVAFPTGDGTWEQCCGCSVYNFLSECLVGSDVAQQPECKEIFSKTDLEDEQESQNKWLARHFPNHREVGDPGQYISIPYRACIVLGSTGWSGFSDEENRYWACTFKDLDNEGQSLYLTLKRLYPDCTLELLTFLDT